jgi:hypothetical protein
LAAGVACAGLAASTAVLAASTPAQADTAVSLGNYTCFWTIQTSPLGTKEDPFKKKIDIPVSCNGVMTTIDIAASGINPGGYINWRLEKNPPCSGTTTCDLQTVSDGYDKTVEACIRVQVRAASAYECKTRDVG